MKNHENNALLAHKRKVDAERRAKAVGKRRIMQHNAALAMARVFEAGHNKGATA
jgi:hypothetical protein